MNGALVELVQPRDHRVMSTVGVEHVCASDTAPFPALEFTWRDHRYRLELEDGISVLRLGSHALCEFVYTSSLITMRYRLDGWNPRLDIPPCAVAYMVAMQLNALAEHDWHHRELFAQAI